MDGKIGKSQSLQLLLAWKGISNFLGWGGVAPSLQPGLRGKLAYIMGHRYLRLGKPDDAKTFFQTAIGDAPKDSPLRQLSQQDLDSLTIQVPARFRRPDEAEKATGRGTTHASIEDSADEQRWMPWQNIFDGKSLDGWRHADKGNATVENGQIILDTSEGACTIVASRDLPKTNYELSLVAKRFSGTDFCSTTFAVGDRECTLIVGGYGGEIVGLGTLDGRRADNNETTHRIRFENNHWYTVRMRVTAELIRVWLDDEELIDLPMAGRTIAPHVANLAPLGVYAWQGKSAIRSIRLRQRKP